MFHLPLHAETHFGPDGTMLRQNVDMCDMILLFNRSVFHSNDAKASDYCCMLLNECLADEMNVQQLIKQPEGQQIIESVLSLCEEETHHDFRYRLSL